MSGLISFLIIIIIIITNRLAQNLKILQCRVLNHSNFRSLSQLNCQLRSNDCLGTPHDQNERRWFVKGTCPQAKLKNISF